VLTEPVEWAVGRAQEEPGSVRRGPAVAHEEQRGIRVCPMAEAIVPFDRVMHR
jgi:hypothetical protein